MTHKIADLAIKVGTYEKNGETKNRYKNVGTVLQTDNGGKMYLLDRTFAPSGAPMDSRYPDTVILSVFEVKGEASAQPQSVKPASVAEEIPIDSIPF